MGELVGIIDGITAHAFAFVEQHIKEWPVVAAINLDGTAVIVDLYCIGKRDLAGIVVS